MFIIEDDSLDVILDYSLDSSRRILIMQRSNSLHSTSTSASSMSIKRLQKEQHHLSQMISSWIRPHVSVELDDQSEADPFQSFLPLIKPNYLTMSENVLHAKLTRIWPHPIQTNVREEWFTPPARRFLRRYLHCLSRSYILQYKEDLWKSYANMSIVIQVERINLNETFITENHLSSHIRQICLTIQIRLKQIRRQLNHLHQTLSRYLHNYRTLQLSMDRQTMSQCIATFVQDELELLRTFYAWKKIHFQYHIEDYCFVHSFYQLHSNDDQASIARWIWSLTQNLLRLKEQSLFIQWCLEIERNMSKKSMALSLFKSTWFMFEPMFHYRQYRMKRAMKTVDHLIAHYRRIIRQEESSLYQQMLLTSSSFANRIRSSIELRRGAMVTIHEQTITWKLKLLSLSRTKHD